MSLTAKPTAIALLSAILFASAAPFAYADNTVDIDAKAKDVVKSLVVVEYTLRNENNARPESGQGLLIQKDGVILIAGSLIPEAFPKEWIKDLKVRLPLKDFTTVPATFLGRTEDRLFAFIKLDPKSEKKEGDTAPAKPFEMPPAFDAGALAPTTLGEDVFSVGMLPKAAGYGTYVGVAQVKAVMDLTHSIARTGTFGLTTGMSPVFDSHSGNLVGITLPSIGEGLVMREGNTAKRIELTDDDQSSVFLPQNEIADLFKNIPTKPFETKHPWLAVDEIAGLQEEFKTLKNIQQPSGITIGSVIAGEVADKAGLVAGDVVLTVDGKQFSTSPVPEVMVMHFSRLIEKHHPGDEITLGILRDGKTQDVKVKLGTAPKQSGDMAHVFSPKIGITTRDLVFVDAYARHLPQDTKGVMIVLVKNGAPAALGSTPLRPGLLITKVDDQPVDNQEQFLAAMKKLDDDKDAKEAVFVVIQPTGETGVCRIDLTK